MINPITALVLTYNEQENIARTLEALRWISKVLLVDSLSTDSTLEIARSFPNVEVHQRKFDTFAGQCNFGLSKIASEWVLSLDADYVLTSELVAELQALNPPSAVAGYSASFNYCVFGRRLRSSLYPARTVLYRWDNATYEDEGHGHRVRIKGNVRTLAARIDHDDRKPLSRWIQEQDRYARLEAEYLSKDERIKDEGGSQKSEFRNQMSEVRQLELADKVRKMIFAAPLIMPVYLLIGRGLILDGWRGWYYVFQRTLAEMMLALRLLELRLSKGDEAM